MPWLDIAGSCDREGVGELNGCMEGACALAEEETALWKPLVLLIPLRLGLSDINEAYIETLKVRNLTCQSISMISQAVRDLIIASHMMTPSHTSMILGASEFGRKQIETSLEL